MKFVCTPSIMEHQQSQEIHLEPCDLYSLKHNHQYPITPFVKKSYPPQISKGSLQVKTWTSNSAFPDINRADPKIQIKRIEIPTLCSSISLTQNELN